MKAAILREVDLTVKSSVCHSEGEGSAEGFILNLFEPR